MTALAGAAPRKAAIVTPEFGAVRQRQVRGFRSLPVEDMAAL